MAEAVYSLIGVLFGSFISLTGVFFVERSVNSRHERQVLQQNLSLVEDAVIQVFEQCQIAVEAKRDVTLAANLDNVAINVAVVRLSMRSAGVGDEPLGELVNAVVQKLLEAGGASSFQEAVVILNEAHRSLKPMAIRVAELRHNKSKVDHGL